MTCILLSIALPLSTTTFAQSDDGLTIDDLKERYPDAEFREVTIEEFETVRTGYVGQTVVIVDPSAQVGHTNTIRESNKSQKKTQSPRFGDPPQLRPQPDGAVRYEPTYDPYIDGNCVAIFDGMGSIDSAELAVVLFVVVGVVVVAAQVLYLGKFIYDVATGQGDYEYWAETSAQGSWLTGSGRAGGLYGGKLSFGFIRDDMHMGLAIEGGYLDAEVSVEGEGDEVEISGSYGLGGPSLRFDMDGSDNPTLLLLEVMLGGTDHENVGLMSTAKAGITWGLGSHARIGFHLGSLYMDIDEEEIPLQTESDFNLLIGGEFGARF